MFKKILKEIVKYNKIIILRHKNPDYDAYGSQFGLQCALKNAYPKKEILVAGDDNQNNPTGRKMDELKSTDYLHSLVIVVDTSCKALMYDENYLLADKVCVLDHHDNDPDVGDLVIIKKDYSSAAELITEFLYKSNITITKEAADLLYLGIAGDSNRFLYRGTTSNTFKMCSILLDAGADIINIYKTMQKDEKENEKHFRGYILSNFKVEGKVAYNYVTKEVRKKYHVPDTFSSRGCVGLLAGISGVESFLNFTEADDDQGTVYVEFRSKDIPIIDIAKRHGGGGHMLACGCRIKIGDDYMKIVEEVNEEIKRYEHLQTNL